MEYWALNDVFYYLCSLIQSRQMLLIKLMNEYSQKEYDLHYNKVSTLTHYVICR